MLEPMIVRAVINGGNAKPAMGDGGANEGGGAANEDEVACEPRCECFELHDLSHSSTFSWAVSAMLRDLSRSRRIVRAVEATLEAEIEKDMVKDMAFDPDGDGGGVATNI
jgi:hypothetical protein